MAADGNPNQVIFDRAVRHRIALERYSTEDAKQVLRWLEDLKTDIQARLVRATPGRRAELERLLDDVRDLHTATYRKIQDELTGRWRERAGLEADWQVEKFRAAGITASIGRLTTDGAFQAAMARPMDGAILSDWLTGLSSGARSRIDKALTISWTEGESLDKAIKRIRDVTEINKRSARTLVRTANTHISNAVQQASAEANADIVKEVEWRSVLDSRTSPTCRSRDGQRYPVNEGPRPPAHPGCLPGNALVSTGTRVTGAFKRWYDGEVIILRTASGKEFTSTPNHPVLTSAGWVAAAHINVGAYVVCDAGIERMPAFLGGDDQNVEASIKNATEAFFRSEQMATMPMPTTAEDFHGDGIDNQIAIVAINRLLRPDLVAALGEFIAEPNFIRRAVGLASLTGNGRLDQCLMSVRNAPLRGVGFDRQSLSSSRLSSPHTSSLLGRLVSEFVAPGFEFARNDRGRNAVLQGNARNANPGLEQLDEVIDGERGDLQWVDDSNTSALQRSLHSRMTDAELAAHLLDGAAGPVALDKVVSVRSEPFSAHVYNLETEGGWYVANGIVTHNCRSIVVEVLDGSPPAQRETYGEWIKRQPESVQDEILGPTRAKMLRQGRFQITDFVDTTGQALTLDELKYKAPTLPNSRLRRAQDSVILAGQAAGDTAVLTAQAISDAATLATQAVTDAVTLAAGDMAQKLAEMKAALAQSTGEQAAALRQSIGELQTMLSNMLQHLNTRR